MTESSESAKGEANRVKPASGRFDQTSIILHWLMVLLIAIQFSSAWLHETVDDNSSIAAALLDTHRNSGVLIWILATARLIWRNNYAYLPPFPESMPKLQQAIAKANEYSLYAVLLVQPITGVGRVLLRGMPFDLFIWKVPALFEPDDAIRHLFVGAHELGANALLALIGLHAGAALFHYLFLRDGVLQRMLPWTSQPVRVPKADAPLAVNDVE